MPIANATQLLSKLSECLATTESAQACGEALVQSVRNNPVAAGLWTAGAILTPLVLLKRNSIANGLSQAWNFTFQNVTTPKDRSHKGKDDAAVPTTTAAAAPASSTGPTVASAATPPADDAAATATSAATPSADDDDLVVSADGKPTTPRTSRRLRKE